MSGRASSIVPQFSGKEIRQRPPFFMAYCNNGGWISRERFDLEVSYAREEKT